MKTIITIQHPQSEQHTNKMIGSWNNWDLTDPGVTQAHRIGERLSAELGATPYLLYASDLLRARHTAEIVGGYLHAEPVFTERLREFYVGEAVGRSKEWARGHLKCPVWRNTVDWAASVDGRPFDGAESMRDVWERLRPFFREVTESPAENFILVAHDGVLRIFYAMWLGWELGMLERCVLAGKAGGVSFLREDEEGHRIIERLNDMSYIK